MGYGSILGQKTTGLTAQKVSISDSLAELLSIDTPASVEDAILSLYLEQTNRRIIRVTVLESGNHAPIANCWLENVTDENGDPIQTDANGYALCFSSTDSTVVKIDSGYIDLSGQSTVATPAGSLHSVTIYGRYSGSATNTTKEYTSSDTVIFSSKVSNVDVHAIGGGASGGFFRISSSGGTTGDYCSGGAMGASNVVLSASFTPNTKYPLTIGKGGKAITNSSSYQLPNNGASSSFLSCTAQGGQGAGSGNGIEGNTEGYVSTSASNGTNSTYTRFNEGGEVFAGGEGGGAGLSNKPRPEVSGYGLGGTPNGGRGGWYYNRSVTNGAAGSRGGGGGGGVGTTGKTDGGSGAGGNGIVLVRYRY